MPTPQDNTQQDPSSRRPINKDKGADPLERWRDLISERIENAMKDGAFDNLPGKGKPLVWDDNPNEPVDLRMANKLLKNNDLTPSWIADRKAILADVDVLRADIMRTWQRTRQVWPDTEREWNRAIAEWEERIVALNRRILDINLILPVVSMELLRLRMDDELRRAGASRTPNL